MKKLLRFGAVTVLSLSSLLGLAMPLAHAAASTCTWTGASSNTFSTAANWSNCNGTAPQAGDVLNFTSWVGPPDSGSTQIVTLNNDLGYAFGGLIGVGSTSDKYYDIANLALADGATASSNTFGFMIANLTSVGSVVLGNGIVVNGGNIQGTMSTTGTGPFIYGLTTTNAVITSGTQVSVTAPPIGDPATFNVTNLTIQNGATFTICSTPTTETTLSGSVTLGGGAGVNPILYVSPCMGADGVAPHSGGLTLTGNVVLLSDATISANSNILSVDGTLTANGHTLTVTADGTSSVMGSGTTGNVVVAKGGTLAPGHSPGCLSTGNLTVTGTFQAQLGGIDACTGYDQVKVTGTVDVTGATLGAELFGDFLPAKGQTFELISNDGADAVVGTFAGLAEGATFKVGTSTFSITYVGGDGNDVVISFVTAPGTPDTGFALASSHPQITLGVTILAAGSILAIARRTSKATGRR